MLSGFRGTISLLKRPKPLLSGALVLCMLLSPFIPSHSFAEESGTTSGAFTEGVRFYREGHYSKAMDVFDKLHKENATDINTTYYLAITSAQLGRFKQAKILYEQILLLDPNGQAGQLAREGMKYLPDNPGSLDLPPRFQAGDKHGTSAPSPQPAQGATTTQTANNGMSPQDLQAMQMMMMMGGNGMNTGSGNSMNMMMPMMMGNGQGMQGMDPNLMSTMMMNQMMQNFNLGGSSNDNQ